MSTEDAVLSVCIAFAPYDTVMPAVLGLFRAEFGYTRVEENTDQTQIARLEQIESQETQSNVMYVNSVLVAEPEASPGITLIEDWGGPSHTAMGSLLPSVSFLSLFSLYEAKNCEQHRYQWREGPELLRECDLDRNMCRSGWCWHENGKIQPWEDAKGLGQKAVSKRLDRAKLLSLASAHGVDLQATLGARKLKRGIFAWQVSEWDARAEPAATTIGDTYHQAAIKAGFGTGETEKSFDQQVQNALACQAANAEHEALLRKFTRMRSAAGFIRLMTGLDPSANDEFSAYMRMLSWNEACRIAYGKFSDDPDLERLGALAIEATQHQEFGLTTERLNQMRRFP